MKDDEVHSMSDRDRAFASEVGKHVIASLLDAAQNKEIAGRVIDNWAGEVQRIVGRAVLRLVVLIVGAALLLASFKLGLTDWLSGIVKGH